MTCQCPHACENAAEVRVMRLCTVSPLDLRVCRPCIAENDTVVAEKVAVTA
ncbi:MAG: hypothetical protein JWN27_2938 [Candidatus Eremiobacteraeota bacterium]|nr:hypothetical protein [Candidatus Eremiobacteraeota bacterium]